MAQRWRKGGAKVAQRWRKGGAKVAHTDCADATAHPCLTPPTTKSCCVTLDPTCATVNTRTAGNASAAAHSAVELKACITVKAWGRQQVPLFRQDATESRIPFLLAHARVLFTGTWYHVHWKGHRPVECASERKWTSHV